MAVFKSELTWSFSRDRLFRDCPRAYYYHYYASWGGWEASAPELSRKAYLLRNMQNLDTWIGDVIHQVIKWVLENRIEGKAILPDEALNKTKQTLLKTWEQSRSKAWMNNAKHNLNLFEHYYNREPSREELSIRLAKAQRSIANFYGCGLLESLETLSSESFLKIDELDSFSFEGVKVFAVPDFALKSSIYTLYDWKTGKPSDKDVLQLSCYGLYAYEKWSVQADSLKIIPVYLAEEVVSLIGVKALEIEEVRKYIRGSIDEMKACLIEVASNKADIGKMPKTQETWRCKNCKFQEICL
ncbi:MAG: PD-(D/E)XK nuclease family protein [Candidatus Omnitrophica bacterium]|nr:PD-(D/E)XK nuclease family protein [Candidatus Omnitrophota bacterium]